MKVFISWSGPRSHQIAMALRDWLPSVLPYISPWVSSEDIPKGARWTIALGSELESTKFGIICLVPDNVGEPWVYFEAGSMSRWIDTARVAPLLVGVDRKDVPGPLAQFQSTIFEKDDVRKLVHSINRASPSPIDQQRLARTFDLCWAGLVEAIQKAETHEVAVNVRPAVPHEDLFKQSGSLPKEQVTILTVLAGNRDAYPTTNMMARAINENPTRTEYHLNHLRERRLINYRLVAGEPATYYLTDAGIAYVVDNNLI